MEADNQFYSNFYRNHEDSDYWQENKSDEAPERHAQLIILPKSKCYERIISVKHQTYNISTSDLLNIPLIKEILDREKKNKLK